jgi:assimilatory nitrate reductase catalytic subunit
VVFQRLTRRVKLTEVVREGDCFVPFHFSEQLINNLTIPEFDPKSFEPNFKQCAVNLYSDAVPEGIVQKTVEIAGVLEEPVGSVTANETIKEASKSTT